MKLPDKLVQKNKEHEMLLSEIEDTRKELAHLKNKSENAKIDLMYSVFLYLQDDVRLAEKTSKLLEKDEDFLVLFPVKYLSHKIELIMYENTEFNRSKYKRRKKAVVSNPNIFEGKAYGITVNINKKSLNIRSNDNYFQYIEPGVEKFDIPIEVLQDIVEGEDFENILLKYLIGGYGYAE